ncbi:MAG TPA: TolC family protein, partial [Opitutus sp.]|nr:TolC family protein [Opitutus sp.]
MQIRPLIVSLAAVCLASPVPASAGSDAAQTDLLRAVAEAPALSAASRRALAARERAESSGRLADPEVEGMTSRMTGPMGDRSTMYEVNIRQPLPKRGERAADRERAAASVTMAEADYALMMGEMAADTAMALAEAESSRGRLRLLETQLARLAAVLRSIDVRLAAGTNGRIADRLTVQTRIASMQLMIEEEQKNMDDALSEARGRLGLGPDEPLPAYAAPSVGEITVDEAAA